MVAAPLGQMDPEHGEYTVSIIGGTTTLITATIVAVERRPYMANTNALRISDPMLRLHAPKRSALRTRHAMITTGETSFKPLMTPWSEAVIFDTAANEMPDKIMTEKTAKRNFFRAMAKQTKTK
ncbi:MAG: hypothetical protein QW568_03975 [Candidatus Anstonellaceae archaeon]